MDKQKRYMGIDKDPHGAINPTGNIIRDAWVFGIIPESETCAGWTVQGIDALYDKVTVAWEPYGHLVSNLPQQLRERHQRIYTAAVEQARSLGWDPELGDEG
jgi:hypothetical protein